MKSDADLRRVRFAMCPWNARNIFANWQSPWILLYLPVSHNRWYRNNTWHCFPVSGKIIGSYLDDSISSKSLLKTFVNLDVGICFGIKHFSQTQFLHYNEDLSATEISAVLSPGLLCEWKTKNRGFKNFIFNLRFSYWHF